MSLTVVEIDKIAGLARLAPSTAQKEEWLNAMNRFFDDVVTPMQALTTQGVSPLAHPTDLLQTASLRLADDVVMEPNHREALMQNAPAQAQGMFLVPRVIE